ncbi:MAG: substrate-binding domain-containing protein [Frankiaceae bacterium]|nr:substrate-binding domain-containing protein [Frankiaceae bacterium]MBV9368966.1 substrate-binding domain-containing protein [Frankiales bacterium]
MAHGLLRSQRRLPVLALAALAFASACASTSKSPSTTPGTNNNQAPTTSASSGADQAALAKVYQGTLSSPDTTSRPAVKGKKIVIISAGQSSISSSIPVNAAKEAAQAIGWSVTVYDAQLNPANYPQLVSQAIASGADGIVLDAIDCSFVKSQLEQAKSKGIKVVPIYAYDCNDPYAGKGGVSLFSGYTNYGAAANKNLGAFAEQYGYAQGQAAIAATGGQAKVIFFNDPEATVLHYTGQGFLNAIKTCAGCKVVADVEFKGLDLGPTLQQRAASVLLQHPEANVVKSPFTAATLLSIAPAVTQSGRASKLYVMGGEGFQPELDLMRTHQGVSAVMISPSDWTGWSAVDTLNSLFQGKAPAFSGLGWQLVDPTHNLPASGPWVSPIDFKSIYKKAWGVG